MGCCRHFDYRIGTSRRFLLIPQTVAQLLPREELEFSMHLDCLGMGGSKKRNTRFHKYLEVCFTLTCPGWNLQVAKVDETHPCFPATWVPEWLDENKNLTCQNWRGVKNHLLALPFISGVTSCWSRVERDGRQETRWEL